MSNLLTWRDAVQLRLINVSAGKAYVPDSADLQLELLRQSWEKNPYRTKTWDKFRRESLTAALLIYTQEVFAGGTSLFPSTVLNLEIPRGSLGCSQATEFTFTENLCALESRNLKENLKYVYFCTRVGWKTPSGSSKPLPSKKSCTARWQNRLGSHPALTTNGQGQQRVPKRTYHHPRRLEEHRRNQSPIKAIPFKASPDGSRYYGPVLPLPCQKQAGP